MSQQIVHNTGTNYTLYYNVVNYWKTIMNNHPGIGAASMGDLWDFGERQFPQYPIANIQILETDFGISVSNFRCQLMVADKVKNRNNESNPTDNTQTIPYYQVDDKVDIYANTLAIINDLTSYTQRGVQGFEINDDIVCTPFADRLDNGVAGWTAEFTLTTHNDKNRCLFFLINPSGSGYIIEDCNTGDKYKAVLAQSGSIGQVFASRTNNIPNRGSLTYYGYNCYTIVSAFSGSDDFDYVNLPIMNVPYANFETCEYCELWTNPQIWSTTPQNWSSGSNVAFRQWQYD
jgi:hypothetical protein